MDKNLQIAIEASLEAGKIIMQVYDSVFDVEIKDDKSPLTIADKKANTVINTYLKKTEYPIISEENKQIDYATRKNWKTCWVVDPVDGTKEFIKRNGEFTVNIALVTNGKPELGVIYAPATRTIYFTNVHTKKAFKNEIKSYDTSIKEVINSAKELQPKIQLSKIVQVVSSRSHMSQETLDFIETIKLGTEQDLAFLGQNMAISNVFLQIESRNIIFTKRERMEKYLSYHNYYAPESKMESTSPDFDAALPKVDENNYAFYLNSSSYRTLLRNKNLKL